MSGIHAGSYQQGWGDACELLAQKFEQAADLLERRERTHVEDGWMSALREAARVSLNTNPAGDA